MGQTTDRAANSHVEAQAASRLRLGDTPAGKWLDPLVPKKLRAKPKDGVQRERRRGIPLTDGQVSDRKRELRDRLLAAPPPPPPEEPNP